MALERHAPAAKVRDDGPQLAEPPGTEDDVVSGQWHDIEIGRKRLAIDEQGRVADDPSARDPLTTGDQGGEARLLAEG